MGAFTGDHCTKRGTWKTQPAMASNAVRPETAAVDLKDSAGAEICFPGSR